MTFHLNVLKSEKDSLAPSPLLIALSVRTTEISILSLSLISVEYNVTPTLSSHSNNTIDEEGGHDFDIFQLIFVEQEEAGTAAAESGYTSGSEEEEAATATDHQLLQGNLHPDPSDSDDSSSSDEEDDEPVVDTEAGFEVVRQPKIKKRKALSYEGLAIGEQMVKSKKSKRDLMDAGWNRFMFDDEGLPDWFVKEEELHMKREVELDPETVQKYR